MSGSLPTTGGYAGQEWHLTGGSPFNAIAFLVRQIAAGKAFSGLVKVISVHGGGAAAPPPTVDVQPLVNQIDGFGNQTPHGTVYGLPCFRFQGGTHGIVADPIAGDIGDAVICDRDISSVKTTGAVAGPGSRRQNDWADGCYFGGFLGKALADYVAVSLDMVAIVSAGTVDVTAPTILLNGGTMVATGTLNVVGTLMVNGTIVAVP